MIHACTVCGLPLPEAARFCPNCGAAAGALVETEERKLVTVLFADLVDSTGFAQTLDAERAREMLGRFFDAASEERTALRGRPEKCRGDAVTAVFGLPHVHEDDALRAVRAGLAISERTRRLGDELGLDRPLEVRVGIETGEAAVGRSPTGQLLVTGPVVNLAARLQAAAQPGQVLVGQTRLADELAAGVSAAVLILRGQSRALTDTATFSPAAAIIGDVAGVRSGDAPDVVRERLVELAGRVSDARASARTAQRLALL